MIVTKDTRFVLRDGLVHIVQLRNGEDFEGENIKEIFSADVHYEPDSVVTATITLAVVPDGKPFE